MVDYANVSRLTVAQIQAAVCQEWGISLTDMGSSQTSRTQHISRARQVAMYLARRLTNEKLVMLAMDFGLRDHTTVVQSLKRITERMAGDPFLALRVTALEARLQYPQLVEHF